MKLPPTPPAVTAPLIVLIVNVKIGLAATHPGIITIVTAPAAAIAPTNIYYLANWIF